MSRSLLLVLLCFSFSVGHSQSYLGWVTTQVNFREGPGTNTKVMGTLPEGTQIFIISAVPVNDFISIIDIATNKEGYVSRTFVKQGDLIQVSQGGTFQPTGETAAYEPEIKIYNNTDKTLTLLMNEVIYTFHSRERKSLKLNPGIYKYRASAPGVIPDLGVERLENNRGYEWEFYIVSR
ncbi:MAG TPA: SH3 domain-containing protein [Anditalea sp.]|nr:SH3 domain-containing protein [Anditalea sp.]